jgi:hypothetical protein
VLFVSCDVFFSGDECVVVVCCGGDPFYDAGCANASCGSNRPA